ncbi:GNAT family N-acetyltransferase [Acidisoma cellulosilyticum]|nr:GNAT family N-acetyltransferase [Acidisoma cellulosilyticum]
MRPEDRDAWMPLWLGYQTFYEVSLSDLVTDTLWSRMLDAAEPVFAALAWDGEKAVGLVHFLYHRNTWTVGDLCYLNDLFTLPAMRGTGVGRALIAHCCDTAKAAGCESVYWHTHETNSTAQALYNKVAKRSGFIQYAHSYG